MKNHPSALAARCAAFNAVFSEVNRLAPLYRAVFAEFNGQRVTKVDGSLLKKIAERLPKSTFQIYSPHVGCFVVKTSETFNECAYYAEQYFYAFHENKHAGHVCEKMGWEFEPFKCDWTPETVFGARKTVELAEAALNEAKNKLGPFGMYDR